MRLAAWQRKALLMFLAMACGFSLSLMIPTLIRSPQANSSDTAQQVVAIDNKNAQVVNKQRIDGLKSAVLGSWQQQAEAKSIETRVPNKLLGTTLADAKLNPGKKYVALTFDDGPWPENTDKVLDILQRENVKATFFVVGQVVKAYPQIMLRITNEGHAIGNHTWHHWYHFFNEQAAAAEIDRTADLIFKITGVKTNLFRPPGGILHNGLAAYARKKKYVVVMWSADSKDYARPSVQGLINNVVKNTKNGGIALMHDGGGNRAQTIAALPQMISNLRSQGYNFVTVPELLDIQEQQRLDKKRKPTLANNGSSDNSETSPSNELPPTYTSPVSN